MGNILIIEDDKTVSRIVARFLKVELGLPSKTFGLLKEVREAVENGSESFDLAIVDYNIPDAPNGESIDYIISKNIPVIVMTASFDMDIRDRMLSKKIIDYIVKRNTKDLSYLVTVVKRAFEKKGLKALVVDDSSVYRDLMKEIMQRQMLTVFSASNGAEALKVIDDNPDICIVVTDYAMPVMDGFELLTGIRKKYKKDTMAVIVASGQGGHDVIPQFLKAGANDYMMKPFSTEEFVCRVDMNLENLRMIKDLKEFANNDPLTGLYNRRYLFEAGQVMLSSSVRNKIQMAVVLMDIDHFKSINDTYGHDGGDMILKSFADFLKKKFNRKTDVVARIGGEEFCVLTPCKDIEAFLKFVDNARLEVEQNVVYYGAKIIKYTFSAGISIASSDNLADTIRHADDLLYKAKNSGRNTVRIQ